MLVDSHRRFGGTSASAYDLYLHCLVFVPVHEDKLYRDLFHCHSLSRTVCSAADRDRSCAKDR